MPSTTRFYSTVVRGRNIFYREAGNPTQPTIVLLHGFPSSSHMFRDLIPELADCFHVIAPDYVGFGYSDAPSAEDFAYTFDNLTEYVTDLLDQLGLKTFWLYMQDYGGPVGFRIFAEQPERILGLVIQNANAYMEGVGELPQQVFLPLWAERNAATEAAARRFLAVETTKYQYTVGAREVSTISPDNWVVDQALLDRPGTDAYQLDLLEDYKTNVALYDGWHASFREHQPRTLIVWGTKDPFFTVAGAQAFKKDLPNAKLVLLDAGHFLLDENGLQVAQEIKTFFNRVMPAAKKLEAEIEC